MGVWKKQKTFRITRDLMRLLQKEHLLIFQSTLPDPRSRAPVTAIARFQSTLPERGETFEDINSEILLDISIHSPRMGRDAIKVDLSGRTSAISIHSPRMGRDSAAWPDRLPGKRFQSTLPAWGETSKSMEKMRYLPISIHSPRMGRDGGLIRPVDPVHISIHSPRMGRDGSHARIQ